MFSFKKSSLRSWFGTMKQGDFLNKSNIRDYHTNKTLPESDYIELTHCNVISVHLMVKKTIKGPLLKSLKTKLA